MKTARFILKIVGGVLALAAVTCLVIGYWDKITEGCNRLTGKLRGDPYAADYDDDWDA